MMRGMNQREKLSEFARLANPEGPLPNAEWVKKFMEEYPSIRNANYDYRFPRTRPAMSAAIVAELADTKCTP